MGSPKQPVLYPLRFKPLFKRHLWGGRRLATELGKPIGQGDDYAESWEVVDHGDDQSVVSDGPLRELTLAQLVDEHGEALLGIDYPQIGFPLLWKFLDAHRVLSVQVHPDDSKASRLVPPDRGKTEAWIVLAADPGSVLYAGLVAGVDREKLTQMIEEGKCESCLHRLEPVPGDCIYIPAGTVHAIGGGLLIAEIQQASDTTYRLFDWNRFGADGQPRQLHIAQGLDVIDYNRGPISIQKPQPTDEKEIQRLVAGDHFTIDRWQFARPLKAGGDGKCHLLSAIEGEVEIPGDPQGKPLMRGEVLLLPASMGAVSVTPRSKATLLDVYLP
ncbi:MAG: mannose-6-phosphate isomerase [Planctomycetaceae bacterium]|nr:mannose-6-phosphate isomerase [Planctomycetaceae bacterium]|tara:strand:- start:2097 stop:3083 length:987 start_codon:yes stop_codon:yes gene_type:complete